MANRDNLKKRATKVTKWIFSLNGLLFTLILGIFINIITEKIDEIIKQQTYHEMLSYELRTNMVNANQLIKSYTENDKRVLNEKYINDEVYKSGLNSGLILSIEPQKLSEIMALYSVIPMYNASLKSNNDLINASVNSWINCINEWQADVTLKRSTGNEKERCIREREIKEVTLRQSSETIVNFWNGFRNSALEISKTFNPTQKRLNDPWIKILMGERTLEFLK